MAFQLIRTCNLWEASSVVFFNEKKLITRKHMAIMYLSTWDFSF